MSPFDFPGETTIFRQSNCTFSPPLKPCQNLGSRVLFGPDKAMPNPQPHLEEKKEVGGLKSVAETCEYMSKVGASVLAFLYLLGLITENLYLGSIGISDFSILETRYVMTGALNFFAFVLTTLGACLTGMMYEPHPKAWRNRWERTSRFGPLILLPLLIWPIWAGAIHWNKYPHSVVYFDGAMTAGWIGLVQFIAFGAGKALRKDSYEKNGEHELTEAEQKRRAYLRFFLVTLFSLMLFTETFATQGYQWMSPSIGGGSPQIMRLLLDKDKKDSLQTLGCPFLPAK